jgi:hypothetical protein
LEQGWREVRDWTGTGPEGLRPPEEVFDSNTLRAWQEAGGSYVLAMNQARSASPEVYRLDGGPLVLLPRLLKDDYNVFVQDGAVRVDRLKEAFLGGMEKIRSVGGLAVVTVHTQIVGTGTRLDAIRTVGDTAKAQGDWWIARAGEVAGWWKERASVRVSFGEPEGAEPTSASDPATAAEKRLADGSVPLDNGLPSVSPGAALQILVEAPADAKIHGLWVDVVIPDGMDGLTPFIGGLPVSYSATEVGIRVPVGNLEAGETRSISFLNLPSGP